MEQHDCRGCSEYNTCTELCERAEAYVGQDYVPQREITIGSLDPVSHMEESRFNLGSLPDLKIFHTKLSRRESDVLTLLLIGFTRKEIQKQLGITNNNLRVVIHNMRKKAINQAENP